MSFKKVISKEEINTLPLFEFTGKIELITTTEDAITAAKELSRETLLGFDTETRPSFTKGESYDVSLLQLATKDKAYLFRLHLFKFPKLLADVLENEKIKKVGVAINDDIKGLQKLYPFVPQGFFEIADMAKTLKVEHFGLRALTAIFIEKRLSKKAKISNWEKKDLSEAQIQYAACDAVSGLLIFEKMNNLL